MKNTESIYVDSDKLSEFLKVLAQKITKNVPCILRVECNVNRGRSRGT